MITCVLLPEQEFLGTVVLVAGALLIEARGEGLDGQLKILFAPIEAYLVGQFITVIILGLGGPTGAPCMKPYLLNLHLTALLDCMPALLFPRYVRASYSMGLTAPADSPCICIKMQCKCLCLHACNRCRVCLKPAWLYMLTCRCCHQPGA